MKLEDQVCNLELARKLKEIGAKQESLFYWVERFPVFNEHGPIIKSGEELLIWKEKFLSGPVRTAIEQEQCSAFTVAELGEMLPYNARSFKCSMSGKDPWTKIAVFLDSKEFIKQKDVDYWICEFPLTGDIIQYVRETENTEADARTKMLIYLIENKLMKVPHASED